MTSLLALLISTLALGYIPLAPEEPKVAVQYFYAEAPANYGSADNLDYSDGGREERFMIIPPPPIKHVNIWKAIRLVFPPVDFTERG